MRKPRWVNFGNFELGFDCLTGQQIYFNMKFGDIYMEIEELSTLENSGIELERYEELRRTKMKAPYLCVHQRLQN